MHAKMNKDFIADRNCLCKNVNTILMCNVLKVPLGGALRHCILREKLQPFFLNIAIGE